MKNNELQFMCELMGKCAYNEINKKRFYSLGKKFLKEIAEKLNLNENDYEIRYNKAGIACSGDWTLHHEKFYISFNMDVLDWILYRTCKGRKDYTGGQNQMFYYHDLKEQGIDGFVVRLKRFLERNYPDGIN